MITGEIKSKFDRIWDHFWSNGLSNPLAVIEQISYLLFMKRLNELEWTRQTMLESGTSTWRKGKWRTTNHAT